VREAVVCEARVRKVKHADIVADLALVRVENEG